MVIRSTATEAAGIDAVDCFCTCAMFISIREGLKAIVSIGRGMRRVLVIVVVVVVEVGFSGCLASPLDVTAVSVVVVAFTCDDFGDCSCGDGFIIDFGCLSFDDATGDDEGELSSDSGRASVAIVLVADVARATETVCCGGVCIRDCAGDDDCDGGLWSMLFDELGSIVFVIDLLRPLIFSIKQKI